MKLTEKGVFDEPQYGYFKMKIMKWIGQHWRGMCRGLGVILLVAGLFFAHWWFYKLAPSRRTWDSRWYNSHSTREYWCEVQKGIHRGMWSHDDGLTVGNFGNKSWAEWIMKHVKPGMSMSCISSGPCHSATAMQYIANQDVGEEADPWLDWWAKNKAKSQEEWIKDGFRERGFDVDVPPKPEQIPIFLKLLGNSETNKPAAIPRHMKYNAFRCLRDSGFEPVAFALSNRTCTAEVERGLIEYARYQNHLPACEGVGILSFGVKQEDPDDFAIPFLLTTRFKVTVYTLIFVPLLIGVSLLILSFCRKRKNDVG